MIIQKIIIDFGGLKDFYTAPRYNVDSTLKTPAYVTVLHNGIIVQNHVKIKGKTMTRKIILLLKKIFFG